ncbi:DNA polymerase Y family protein [Halococcus sediminicola]|uniref:DNA polymerase Y family protein n=1 Tax=Halococcus sediminicola TaxID=1264579 RepID=UPI0006787E6B|nr:DNA polymerase IV [Halococcus sediminicola]
MVERGGSRLPGVAEDDSIVLHVDMDCFYAACERRRNPDLESEPVVVGMGYEAGESHGAVATASYEARAEGIESAQAISTALDRLPRVEDANADEVTGHYLPVDLDYYETVGEEVREVLHDCADIVREVSIDEAALDVTERTSWQRVDGRTLAEGYARHVKERILQEVGVVASIGVAPNMSAAKVAADRDKPDGLVTVEPGEVAEFFAPLDIESVHGVGPVTARECREMGIETAGDLAETAPSRLDERFGERGREIRAFARGDDTRAVTPVGRPKSLSRESAFTEATEDVDDLRERVAALATAVAERAEREEALYRTIGIKVVTPPFDVNTRARSLPGPVADADLLRTVALDLLGEFDDTAVRKVGVRVSNLAFESGEQASLDGFDAHEGERADGGIERTGETDADETADRSASVPEPTDGQARFDDFADE